MDTGEWLTRSTAWLALSLYVASEAVKSAPRGRRAAFRTSRWLNAVGCTAFLAHVAAAFHFYHDWSHAAAYADTARQTAEFAGWNSGAGLYVNYAFALVWLTEVFWAWANPTGFRRRANWLTWSGRVFFLFMTFNGAVVFVRGGMKWFGLALCLTLVCCWWRKRRVDPPDLSQPI